jgi:hypothetical protein
MEPRFAEEQTISFLKQTESAVCDKALTKLEIAGKETRCQFNRGEIHLH